MLPEASTSRGRRPIVRNNNTDIERDCGVLRLERSKTGRMSLVRPRGAHRWQRQGYLEPAVLPADLLHRDANAVATTARLLAAYPTKVIRCRRLADVAAAIRALSRLPAC